jgi:lipopolysaccharide biosynthesis glycosyltransferase
MSKASVIHFCTKQKPWIQEEFYDYDDMACAKKIYKRYQRIYESVKK